MPRLYSAVSETATTKGGREPTHPRTVSQAYRSMKRVLILTANAALVILCCFLASGIIVDVSAALLAPEEVEEASAASAAVISPGERGDRQIILARNLFNVSTLNPSPVADEEECGVAGEEGRTAPYEERF